MFEKVNSCHSDEVKQFELTLIRNQLSKANLLALEYHSRGLSEEDCDQADRDTLNIVASNGHVLIRNAESVVNEPGAFIMTKKAATLLPTLLDGDDEVTVSFDNRAQVRADHGGKVPDHLNLTIRNYANALEIRDTYRDTIIKEGAVIFENGSMGQTIRKQHPICGLLYQQEMLCLSYAKALGGTAAKAAAKPEDKGGQDATNALNEFIDGIK